MLAPCAGLTNVYDTGQRGYVRLAGFDELMVPEYISCCGLIFEEWRDNALIDGKTVTVKENVSA
jgi:hypothetical protein